MDFKTVQQSLDEAKAGVAAIQHGRRDEAGEHFLRVLQYRDEVQDLRERRDLLSEASEFFLKFGFEDLALMSVLEALEADRQLGLERGLIRDSMTRARIHDQLKNLEQAEASYRSLLDHCLKSGDYASAASASTNLAGILADQNYLEEAAGLLENSLDYLKVEEFRATEMMTRIVQVQVLELQAGEPERTFEAARTLLDRFAAELAPRYREVVARSVESALERYLRVHIDIDADGWKNREFPELCGA